MATQKTLAALKAKAEHSIQNRRRMPSLKAISAMLTEFGIEHILEESYNTVEYSSRGNRYVNSRHRGKEGFELYIREADINMDTSDSYYSWNSPGYARKILDFLKTKKLID